MRWRLTFCLYCLRLRLDCECTLILVTGASGFVGTAVVNELAQCDLPVRACSRSGHNGFTGLVDSVAGVDLLSTNDFKPLLEDVTVIVHTAARVHVMREHATDPQAAFRLLNVDSTLRLARQAAAAGVKRFVFVSSIKVNGETTLIGRPFAASDTPNPSDAYGRSKLEAELGLQQIAMQTGLEVVIVRPPLVYGPGVKANFARLVSCVKAGVPLPFGCATTNRRSLVAIDNLSNFLVLCTYAPAAANQTFLVSDGHDVSTAELLTCLGEALGRPARLLPVPLGWLTAGAKILRKTGIAQRLLGNLQIDITKARSVLGWVPPFSLQQGLQRIALARRAKM